MSSNHANNNKYSRRDILKIFGMSTGIPLLQSPLQVMIESILAGASQKAFAQSGVVEPRTLLQIVFEGAPPRWMTDHFLTPYDTSSFQANAHLGNQFYGGAKVEGVQYSTILRKGINVPYLWQFEVPKAGGGTRSMEPLLENLLSLRGINVGDPNHGAAMSMQFLPLGISQSVPAFSADAAQFPIAAISAGANEFKFKSLKSKSAVTISGKNENLLLDILTPFIRSSGSSIKLNNSVMGSALDATVKVINSSTESLIPGSKSLTMATESAKDLLSKGFGDLNKAWDALLYKYTDLMKRSMQVSQTLVGINNLPIISDNVSKKFQLNKVMINSALTADLRLAITPNSICEYLAKHFAMAEFLILNKLTNSITIRVGGPKNININGNLYGGLQTDEHETGSIPSLYLNTLWGLAYNACLLELIDQLKLKNLYQDCVIVAGGEFSRNPRKDQSGSDHGYKGGYSNIYSGAIPSPLILGNIYINKTQENIGATPDADDGTWGHGAPVAELGRPLNMGDWAATLAYLLKVQNPITANSSLVFFNQSQLVSSIEKAKQV